MFPSSPQSNKDEFEEEPQITVVDEFEPDDEFELEDSRMERVKGFILSRRGLLVGVLAIVGASVVGYPMLHEKGPGGKEMMSEYEKLTDPKARHMYVLKQVAAGNMPSTWDDWVTVKAVGKTGMEAEFEVSPHGLRIGHDDDWIEVPLDGPHAMAAAELRGCTLPTYWMAEQILLQAKKTGGLVNFFNDGVIANHPDTKNTLGVNWNALSKDQKDAFKMKPPLVKARNILIKKWQEEHKISDRQLTSCSFKEIVQPVEGLTTAAAEEFSILGVNITVKDAKTNMLEIRGGCYVDEKGNIKKEVQPLSSGYHEDTYFDYSHLPRLVRLKIKVNGGILTFTDFFNNADYSREFVFQKSPVPERAYNYSVELAKFVEENK